MRVVVFLLFVAVAFSQYPTIKIGRTVSLVGLQAAEAGGTINGFNFAISYINNHTGVMFNGTRYNLEAVTWNDASDPALVTRLYEDMITRDKVDILYGPWSTLLTGPALTVANKAGMPIVFAGASSTQFYTSGYNNSFGLLVQVGKRSLPCMQVFGEKQAKTVALITSDDPFQVLSCNIIASQLLARNMTIVYNVTVPRDGTTFSPVDEELNSIRPEVVVLCLAINPIKPFLTEMRAFKWDPSALYNTNSATAALAYEALGWPADGMFAGDQWASVLAYKDPIFVNADGFNTAYKRFSGIDANYLAAASAAGVFVIKDALERAVSLERADIIEALRETYINESFFANPISFNIQGEITTTGICEQLQPDTRTTDPDDRRLAVVGPSTLATDATNYPALYERPPPPPLLSYRQKLGLGLGLGLGLTTLILVAVVAFIIHRKYYFLPLPRNDVRKQGEW